MKMNNMISLDDDEDDDDVLPLNIMKELEMEQDEEDTDSEQHFLNSMVRTCYIDHLQKLLQNNYAKSVVKIPQEPEFSADDFKECATQLEKRALLSCMLVNIYQKTISRMILEIKNNTKEYKLHVKLKHFLASGRKSRRKEQSTQTEDCDDDNNEIHFDFRPVKFESIISYVCSECNNKVSGTVDLNNQNIYLPYSIPSLNYDISVNHSSESTNMNDCNVKNSFPVSSNEFELISESNQQNKVNTGTDESVLESFPIPVCINGEISHTEENCLISKNNIEGNTENGNLNFEPAILSTSFHFNSTNVCENEPNTSYIYDTFQQQNQNETLNFEQYKEISQNVVDQHCSSLISMGSFDCNGNVELQAAPEIRDKNDDEDFLIQRLRKIFGEIDPNSEEVPVPVPAPVPVPKKQLPLHSISRKIKENLKPFKPIIRRKFTGLPFYKKDLVYELKLKTELQALVTIKKLKKRAKIQRKFRRLFGIDDCDSEYLTPEDILWCKERIAKWIVKSLMPYYKDEKIIGRLVFKNLARHIADKLVEREHFPGRSMVKYCVDDFFKHHSVIRNECDIWLKRY